MSVDLSRVGVSGPLSARSRLIPPFCFAPTEEPTIALSGPRCTSSIGLCRRYSGSYRHEFSDTGRHNLEVGIIEIAHLNVLSRRASFSNAGGVADLVGPAREFCSGFLRSHMCVIACVRTRWCRGQFMLVDVHLCEPNAARWWVEFACMDRAAFEEQAADLVRPRGALAVQPSWLARRPSRIVTASRSRMKLSPFLPSFGPEKQTKRSGRFLWTRRRQAAAARCPSEPIPSSSFTGEP
jgi:hypothetical protein